MAIVDTRSRRALFGFALTQDVLPELSTCCPTCRASTSPGSSTTRAVERGIGVAARRRWPCALAFWIAPRGVDEFRARVRQRASTVLRDRPRYLRTRAPSGSSATGRCGSSRSASSCARSTSSRRVRNVLLVQVTSSLATLVPATPGGIGTEQAFIVYVFRGTVPRSALLAFSVGMKLTLTAVERRSPALRGDRPDTPHARYRRVLRRKPAGRARRYSAAERRRRSRRRSTASPRT